MTAEQLALLAGIGQQVDYCTREFVVFDEEPTPVPSGILKVTGLKQGQVVDEVQFDAIVRAISDFLSDEHTISH